MARAIQGLIVSLLLSFGLVGSALAGQLEDGQVAFHREDWEAAQRLLRPLSDQGNSIAQGYIGTMFALGEGVPQDQAQGIELLRKSADQGVAAAQVVLGLLYESGFGARQDFAQAADWYLKAAVQEGAEGSADAQLHLAQLYRAGLGIRQDSGESAMWFAKAVSSLQKGSDQGDTRSQLALASLYDRGEGLAQDSLRAASLYQAVAAQYRKDAEQGKARAQVKLAKMYDRGQGVAQDPVQAAIWYRKAADQGDAEGQTDLGLLYALEGFGEAEDEMQSYIWLSLAVSRIAASLTAPVANIRNQAAEVLTPAQRAQADKFVEEWRPAIEAGEPGGGEIGHVRMTPAQAAETQRLTHDWAPNRDPASKTRCDVTVQSSTAGTIEVVTGESAPWDRRRRAQVSWRIASSNRTMELWVGYSGDSLTALGVPRGMHIELTPRAAYARPATVAVVATPDGHRWPLEDSEGDYALARGSPDGQSLLSAVADGQRFTVTIERDGKALTTAIFNQVDTAARAALLARARRKIEASDPTVCTDKPRHVVNVG